MTLGFSTIFPDGSPTNFCAKVWRGLLDELGMHLLSYGVWEGEYIMKLRNPDGWPVEDVKQKIHTIRADKKNRWKVGNKIHYVIHNRTKKRFQFAPVIKVLSVQKINIEWAGNFVSVEVDGRRFYSNSVLPRSFRAKFERKKMQELANNDGFKSIEDFLQYFSEDFEGKIIHWTDCVY